MRMTGEYFSLSPVSRVWQVATFIFMLVSVVLLIVLIVVSSINGGRKEKVKGIGAKDDPAVCGASNPNKNIIDLREPVNPGIFHDLTVEELRKVRSFLERDGNIRADKSSRATVASSYIYMADLFLPRKADALNYLDNNGSQPQRQARVLLFRGDLDPPVVEMRICGPLPNIESCDLLNYSTRRNPVEFSLRPIGQLEFSAIYKTLLPKIDREIGHILLESFNATWTLCVDLADCFEFGPSPVGTSMVGDINKRRIWLWAFYNVIYHYLHPVDFGVLLNLDGSDVTKWDVDKIWYAGRLYNSMDELAAGYNSRSIPVTRASKPVYTEDLFSTLHRRGEFMPPKPQRPPTLVEPDGKRYSVKGKKVEYLGWTFNFRMSALHGPAIYDVRYKNERIAYEISLQEIAVFYSGHGPLPQSTDYVDGGALIGFHSRALVPGADCPESATLINQTFLSKITDEPLVYASAFCLFEQNNGYPLRRHLSVIKPRWKFYGGMLDSVLTLRSALTVGNYDYIVDFILHQNGAIETRFMSTGYIQSGVYSEQEKTYGFQIEDEIIGNIHYHLAHFKVDLDIGGTSNRYETLDIKKEEVDYAPDRTKKYHQTKFMRSLKNSEKEALYKFNFDHPRYHLVHNDAKRTKYSEIKAYRIKMEGMAKDMLPENLNNEASIPWGRHQLAVTKHKDEEFLSSSNYGMFDSLNPVVNFSSFYADDENIVDEDLVLWVTSGMHHIPHSEDLPVTSTIGTHLNFFLLPYNYFPQCPSMGSRDAIYIDRDDENNIKVERYGNSRTQCKTPPINLEEDLTRNPNQVLPMA